MKVNHLNKIKETLKLKSPINLKYRNIRLKEMNNSDFSQAIKSVGDSVNGTYSGSGTETDDVQG